MALADLIFLTSAFQTYVKNLSLALEAIDPYYRLLLSPPEILDDTIFVQEHIKAIASTDFHFQEHWRMAPLDQGGVFDSKGNVYDANKHLIIDNSIVPPPINGSPMTSAYLIAANIACLLEY